MGNCRFGLEEDQRNVEKWKEEFGWSSKVEDEAEQPGGIACPHFRQ